jgi:ADP-dependent NAD(P)H-hydrate dehydratase
VPEIQPVTTIPKLPPRKADSHKGDFGRVLVVAGSRGMSGAAILCGSAALRGGAGLVTVACPEDIWPIVAVGNPCYMTLPLPERDETAITQAVSSADVVVAGPGIGQSPSIRSHVRKLLQSRMARLLFDADALTALSNSLDLLRGRPGERILTPHPGEFARLTGLTIADVQGRREEVTVDFARKFGGVLVLKGHCTLVCDGQRLYCNTTGNPGLATAGSGDVLSGLIGALWGQGLLAFEAAQLGVYLHGMAGDLARDSLGEASLTASDLLDYLPRAFLAHAAG